MAPDDHPSFAELSGPGRFWMMMMNWTEPFALSYCPCLRARDHERWISSGAELWAESPKDGIHGKWWKCRSMLEASAKCCSFLWSPVQCADHQSSANHQSSSMGRRYTPKLQWVGKAMLNHGIFRQKSNLTSFLRRELTFWAWQEYAQHCHAEQVYLRLLLPWHGDGLSDTVESPGNPASEKTRDTPQKKTKT